MSFVPTTLEVFDALCQGCFANLKSGEELTVNLAAEDQLYLRLNDARVRQSTDVQQRRVTLKFQALGRRVAYTFDLSGQSGPDLALAHALIDRARQETRVLPEDPYLTSVLDHGCSEEHHAGDLCQAKTVVDQIAHHAAGTDFTGLYAAGSQVRASRNSAGMRHVFSAQSFFLDHSLYTVNTAGENKAVKGLHAGTVWREDDLAAAIETARQRLDRLRQDSRTIEPGEYRVYLAPAAVDALIGMFSWGGVSYSAWKKGESALARWIDGEAAFSPLFSLEEDFTLGLAPRFNSSGETAPARLPVVASGQLGHLLTSARTAREYDVEGNGAESSEGLRTPHMASGELAERDILAALDTGLYIANLHYLNWSDVHSARLTGMTRYACFWVERGELVAPIRDLRFDESLYRILGSELESVTADSALLMDTDTYGQRSVGGSKVPGILVKKFRFTL
jgi:predicted Zn-dependent protease